MNNVRCHAEFISASPDPETSSGWHIASLEFRTMGKQEYNYWAIFKFLFGLLEGTASYTFFISR